MKKGAATAKVSEKERQPYAAQAEKIRDECDQHMATYKAEKAVVGEEVDDDEDDEDDFHDSMNNQSINIPG